MTAGLPVFDTTINETNRWLKALEAKLPGCNRHEAYVAMRAALHALRDRLAPGGAMRLAAQLPLLLRGCFVDGWQPDETPMRTHSLEAFVAKVADGLPEDFPYEPLHVARCVIEAVWEQMDGGAIEKVKQEVPHEIRLLWPDQGLFA